MIYFALWQVFIHLFLFHAFIDSRRPWWSFNAHLNEIGKNVNKNKFIAHFNEIVWIASCDKNVNEQLRFFGYFASSGGRGNLKYLWCHFYWDQCWSISKITFFVLSLFWYFSIGRDLLSMICCWKYLWKRIFPWNRKCMLWEISWKSLVENIFAKRNIFENQNICENENIIEKENLFEKENISGGGSLAASVP